MSYRKNRTSERRVVDPPHASWSLRRVCLVQGVLRILPCAVVIVYNIYLFSRQLGGVGVTCQCVLVMIWFEGPRWKMKTQLSSVDAGSECGIVAA